MPKSPISVPEKCDDTNPCREGRRPGRQSQPPETQSLWNDSLEKGHDYQSITTMYCFSLTFLLCPVCCQQVCGTSETVMTESPVHSSNQSAQQNMSACAVRLCYPTCVLGHGKWQERALDKTRCVCACVCVRVRVYACACVYV